MHSISYLSLTICHRERSERSPGSGTIFYMKRSLATLGLTRPMMRMTKSILAILFIFLIITAQPLYADNPQAYLNRFMKYSQWNQQLPIKPDQEFIAFIQQSTPLSNKLREKWLYQLAKDKDWVSYTQYYQPSKDTNLICFSELAHYSQEDKIEALHTAKKIWLDGHWLSKSCDQLFGLLLKDNLLTTDDIKQRIHLAVEKNNLSLAIYLLKLLKPLPTNNIQVLTAIRQNPKNITKLQPGEWFSEFYLYGLKRMVSTDMDKAILLWQSAQTKHLLTHADSQAFIAQVALYKAIRNQDDATIWFAKVEAPFYSDQLLDWTIRYALKYERWKEVEQLIHQTQDKESPCWLYWLARAQEAQGQADQAKQHYEHFTDQIKTLYTTKKSLEASLLLNDFVSELPKNDKIALIDWLAHDLEWYGKSVYLSNTDDLNNQLDLRFPLAYKNAVVTDAKRFQITEPLIYAMIRQESGFRDDVSSSAGALGLMQIMPATALTISKAERIPYLNKQQLFSAQTNISIGTAYLKNLAKRFDQHPILMVAAYNAGPKQVSYWLKNHPPKDIDIWIETLPWHETRNYIKNVIAFYAVYQYRLQNKADLSAFLKEF